MSALLALVSLLATSPSTEAPMPPAGAPPAAETPTPAPPGAAKAPDASRNREDAPQGAPPSADAPVLTRLYLSACDGCAASSLLSSGGDLSRFARQTRSDPELGATGEHLLARHQRSRLFFASGTVVGAGLVTLGLFVLPKSHCFFVDPSEPYATLGEQRCTDGVRNYATAGAGVLSAVLGTVAYLVTRPSEAEFIDAVNRWNGQHPEARFEPSPDSGWSLVSRTPPTGGRQ